MRLRLPFEHEAVDSAEVKQVRQRHARGAAADDRHLSALHVVLPIGRTMHRDVRRGLEHDAAGYETPPIAEGKRREEGRLDDPLSVGALPETRENANFRQRLPCYALATGSVAGAGRRGSRHMMGQIGDDGAAMAASAPGDRRQDVQIRGITQVSPQPRTDAASAGDATSRFDRRGTLIVTALRIVHLTKLAL